MNGIILPAMAHRFRAHFDSPSAQANLDFLKNVVSVHIDQLHQRIEILVRENILGEATKAVQYSLSFAKPFVVECLDGADGTHFKLDFHETKILEHSLKFDYADDNPLVHKLVVSYGSMYLNKALKTEVATAESPSTPNSTSQTTDVKFATIQDLVDNGTIENLEVPSY